MRTASLDNISAHYVGMNIAVQFHVRWTALDGSDHEWPFHALTTNGAIDRIKTFREVGDHRVTVCDAHGNTLFIFQDLE